MSFILDALRKSETERRRQSPPSLADAQYRLRPRKSSPWVPTLVVLLIANAVAIVVVVFNSMADSDQSTATVTQPISNRTGSAAVQPAVEPIAPPVIDSAPPEPAPVQVPVEQHAAADTRQTQVAQPVIAAPVKPTPEPAPEPVGTSPAAGESAIYPSMEELVLAGQLSFSKPLYVDIHVYAGDTSKRFVFINMKKYREGERLDEGPLLEEITRGGVLLNYQGNRFTLTRD